VGEFHGLIAKTIFLTDGSVMKSKLQLPAIIFSFLILNSSFAQGSLTPPGAPVPTMRTLDQLATNILSVSNLVMQVSNVVAQATNRITQVQNAQADTEPRIPISTFQITITTSGSFYLTTNLVSGTNVNDAINVRANDVTIDLNGFSIVGTNPPSGGVSPVGIRIGSSVFNIAVTNVTVRNGQIRGFDRALRAESLFQSVLVENIHAHGCSRAGIEAIPVTDTSGVETITVRNCVVERVDATGEGASVAADGISMLNCTAVVQNCIVRDIFPAGAGTGSCIHMVTTTNSIVDNNFLSNAGVGLLISGGGTRVYYRNNLTAGCPTPISSSGGVDRGGNF
jgi:hypothetical protein